MAFTTSGDTSNERVAVLLSGGVDSAVALAQVVDSGARATAFYLKIWLEDELAHLGSCPWEEDLRYARATCDALGVELEIVPLQREYHERVVSYTISELRAGRTPSPDIFCNQRIKFGAFFDAIGSDYDRVASGHYGRIEQKRGAQRLYRGVDPVKDQTYFLSHLSAEQLARLWFPIGAMPKSDVRRVADERSLPPRHRARQPGDLLSGQGQVRRIRARPSGRVPRPDRRSGNRA